jgi:signal transduction histidine kinase
MLSDWALEDPEAAREGIKNIETETDRLRTLAEALLTLARGDEGPSLSVERQDLREVAQESVEAARAAADGEVSVRYGPPHHAVKAVFDRGQIRQVVSILLDNAVKYTPEGGTVTVRVGEEEDRACIEVSDTGIGIPHEEMPLVFERFHRADSSRTEEGAGLGLAIALQIAEAHGGTIEATSTVGEGSTFTLLLPQESG